MPVVFHITALLHMEVKHSHRVTLAIDVGTDISINRYKNIHLVPSFSFYKILL